MSRPGRARFLRTLFRVQPGELERVVLMLLFSVLAVGGVVITGQLVGRSLFLSTLPASAIPLRFILPPVALVAAVALYTRFSGRLPHTRLTQITFAATIVGVLVCRLLLATPLHGSLAFLLALFVFFDIVGSVAMILFWTFAADLFDPRQAKRLFGLISGGSALSNVAFGALLRGVATRVRPEDLLLVVVASLLLSMWIVGRLGRRYLRQQSATPEAAGPTPSRTQRGAERGTLLQDLREVLGSPLMLIIGAIVVLVALVSNIADYQLDLALKTSYGEDGQGMVRFLALLRMAAGIVAVLLQFLIAGYLMERFGVLPVLLLLPLTIGAGGSAILLSGGALWAVAIPRAADVALKYTINDSAFNLLYLPLSARLRAKAKAVIDGIVKPPLVALLGLVFLAVGRFEGVSLVYWSIPLLLLVAGWVLLLFRASRSYVETLTHSIAMRRLDAATATIDLADETSLRVLTEALQHPDGMRVIHTLSLIRGASELDWTDRVAFLLDYPDPDVRVETLDYLAERAATGHAPRVGELMQQGDERVREAAIAAYCRLEGSRAVRRVVPFLGDESPRIRGAAIVALIRHGGLDGVLHAGRPLTALLDSQDPGARCEGARLLGELGVQSYYSPLLELMDDPQVEVQLAAVRATQRIRAAELVPKLVDKLAHQRVRPHAMRAIVACSGEDMAALRDLLADTDLPREMRVHVARELTRFGTRGAEVLGGFLGDPDEVVRSAVDAALLRLRAAGHEIGLDRRALRDRLHVELRGVYEHLLCLDDLERDGPPRPLLVEALQLGARRDRDRVLALLTLLYPDLPLSSLRQALGSDDPRLRANAVELLDNVVEETRELLIPYVGGNDAQRREIATRRLGLVGQSRSERLKHLAADRDPWLQACALEAIRQEGLTQLVPQIEAALGSADETVGRTALFGLARMVDPGAVRDRLKQAGPANPERVRDLEQQLDRLEGCPMALAPLEKVLFLKQVPLFKEIPGEEVASILPIAEEVSFPAGEAILTQGDVGDSLYIIVEGRVAVTIDGRDTGKMLDSRAVIGELALLTGDPRAATCTAMTEVLALRIDRDPFWQLLHERTEVSIGVIKILLDYLKK